MKKRILLIGALLCGTLLTQAATVQTLVVQPKSGSANSYTLSNVRKITFSDSTMSVVTTGSTGSTYAIIDVQKLLFGIQTATSVAGANVTALKAYPNPAKDVLNVEGVSKVENIALYNIAGTELAVSYTYVNNGLQINTSGLAQGIYLLRVNNQTLKVQKQ
jgi:hypothetical protein